jgi:thioredoxin 1
MAAQSCNDADFETEAIKAEGPVLVDFWAPWCGPCKVMSPVIDALANEYCGRVKVLKVNVDEAPNAAARFGVAAIPNIMVIESGAVVARLTGVRPKQALVDALTPHLK